MKSHLVTIILLAVAASAFTLRFLIRDNCQIYCDIAAFALPTIAAIVEIVLAQISEKQMKKEIKDLQDNQLHPHVKDGTLYFK